jgi:hypothetical protein
LVIPVVPVCADVLAPSLSLSLPCRHCRCSTRSPRPPREQRRAAAVVGAAVPPHPVIPVLVLLLSCVLAAAVGRCLPVVVRRVVPVVSQSRRLPTNHPASSGLQRQWRVLHPSGFTCVVVSSDVAGISGWRILTLWVPTAHSTCKGSFQAQTNPHIPFEQGGGVYRPCALSLYIKNVT